MSGLTADVRGAHTRTIHGCLRYLLAPLTAGLATLFELALRPQIHEIPFALYFPAVLVTTWLGGAGPGLVALVLSALAGNYLFLWPFDTLTVRGSHILPMAVFGTVGAILIGLTATLRSRYRDREVLLREAQAANAERLSALESEQRARAAADDANRAKDEFLAMLGHELRNPLSPIFTALELIRRKGAGEQARELGVIERQASQLKRLVDDLLDVARLTQGKIDLTPERVPVDDIVARACETAAPLVQGKKHSLTVEVEEGLHVIGDGQRLVQALGNVLINAAKYTDAGGEIHVGAAQRGAEVVITVRDNGAGMSADLLENVFEPFIQGPRGLDRSQGGLGLGLALARKLVRLQGGDVVAHSAGTRRGTEIALTLPAAPREGGIRTPDGARTGMP